MRRGCTGAERVPGSGEVRIQFSRPGVELGRFPFALRGTNGRLLFAWVAGDNHVHWQVHGEKGAVVGSGDAGAVAGETRPTGFVDGDGVFVIVQ